MQPTSLYEDPNWSDQDSDNDETVLYNTSQGYTSLGAMPHKHTQAPSWAADEIIQRSNTYANAPKYYNPNQKKHKSATKQRRKMNHKEYASLFPGIDVLIWYLPTYILRNRSGKCKHYTFLIICIVFVLLTIYNQMQSVYITYFDPKEATHNITRGVFYCMLYLNPYIGSCIRFYFFNFKFDWSLWHKKKKKISSTALKDQDSNSQLFSMSYMLGQSQSFKKRLRYIIHCSCTLLIFTMFIKYVFAIAFWCEIVLLEVDENLGLKQSEWAVSITLVMLQALIFILSVSLPDLLMALVARIYFTECYLYIKAFVNELQSMELNDIIDGNICEGYCGMNKKIESYTSVFRLWILNLLLQLTMASWHTLSMYIHSKHVDHTHAWLIYGSIEGLIYFIEVVFILWPAMLMTEKINTLKEVINEKINGILKTRLHFHDELILDDLMKAITQKQLMIIDDIVENEMEMKSMDTPQNNGAIVSGYSSDGYNKYEDKESTLWKSMTTHSKQECALEILNRLKYLSKKNSCCYELFGVQMDRSRIRDFIIVLIATNAWGVVFELFNDA